MSQSIEKQSMGVSDPSAGALLEGLRGLILEARQRVTRTINDVQVLTYWRIGLHIGEFEQGGEERARYGKQLLQKLGAELTAEFGRGFEATNLRHMRAFYRAFPIRDALRPELSWTHYRLLLRVEDENARTWYAAESAAQGWTTRALERQIGTLYYERLLSTSDRAAVEREAEILLRPMQTARDFVRDPVMLEFLGVPGTEKLLEADLEKALLDNLQAFLLELGRGFAFVARQYRLCTEAKDFYVDLVFYNYLLKCFVLFELKTGELTHQDIGQLDMYVRMMDDLKRARDDNPTVGLILCTQKDASVVRYSVLHGNEQLFASRYKLVLPSEDELRTELDRERSRLPDL